MTLRAVCWWRDWAFGAWVMPIDAGFQRQFGIGLGPFRLHLDCRVGHELPRAWISKIGMWLDHRIAAWFDVSGQQFGLRLAARVEGSDQRAIYASGMLGPVGAGASVVVGRKKEASQGIDGDTTIYI